MRGELMIGCIPREWGVWGALLLLVLVLALFFLRKQRHGRDRSRLWKDKIKDARMMRSEANCPKSLARLQRENMERDSYNYADIMERNAVLQQIYSEGRELFGYLDEINASLRNKKVTYEKLDTTEEKFKNVHSWFEKNYRIKRE